MALVKCPDCDRAVSTSARACPHCGAVLKSDVFAKFIVLLVAAIGVVAFFEWKSKQENAAKVSAVQAAKAEEADKKRPVGQKKDKEPPRNKASREGVQRAALGARALKKTIANADHAQLESARVVETGAVCYRYRMLNGFGGYMNGKAVLASDGKQLVRSEMTGFAGLWESECEKSQGTEVVANINWYEF